MLNWTSLPDDAFINKVHHFAEVWDDENPTVVWTIGTKANKHYQRVFRWILANVNLGCLYTCGISSKMQHDLDSVNGNLRRFVNHGYAIRYDEFRIRSTPIAEELRIVIGIACVKYGRDGNIELVDGAHRAVAMCNIVGLITNFYLYLTCIQRHKFLRY